jgi:hypothetical protein
LNFRGGFRGGYPPICGWFPWKCGFLQEKFNVEPGNYFIHILNHMAFLMHLVKDRRKLLGKKELFANPDYREANDNVLNAHHSIIFSWKAGNL